VSSRPRQASPRVAGKEGLFFALLDELDDRLRVLISLSTAAPSERDTTAELGHDLVAMTIPLADGLSIQRLTEPDAVPVDLFGQSSA